MSEINHREPEVNMVLLKASEGTAHLSADGKTRARQLRTHWPQLKQAANKRQAALDSAHKLCAEFDSAYKSAEEKTKQAEEAIRKNPENFAENEESRSLRWCGYEEARALAAPHDLSMHRLLDKWHGSR